MSEPANDPIEPRAAPPLDELELLRYLDARLDPAEQKAVEERLKACPISRRRLDALREEDKLVRGSVETLSEPSNRIGEKVLAILYAEHRQRVSLQRARVLRNRVIAAVSVAALLMLAIATLKPRDEAGRMEAGVGASILRGSSSPLTLAKNGVFHEGDTLATGRGQFVRLRLSDGSVVDLDEESRLKVEQATNRSPLLVLETGRARFRAGAESNGLLAQTFAGAVRGEAQVFFDLWLPEPSRASWPDWTGAWSGAKAAPDDTSAKRACLSVLEGVAYIHTSVDSAGLPVRENHRVVFGADLPPAAGEPYEATHAIDPQREGWARIDGNGPPERGLLGLTAPFNWRELGARFELDKRLPGGPAAVEAVGAALAALAEGEASDDPVLRAERLGQGQQALRAATQSLLLADPRRWLERTVEGLAHYERGRALLAVNTPQALGQAHGAFLASAVAFFEALEGTESSDPAVTVAPPLGERVVPVLTEKSRLCDLAPADQALLLARFHQPWALYRLHGLMPSSSAAEESPGATDRDPAELFENVGKQLGRTVEALGARFGRAQSLAQAGKGKEAVDVLEEICATSVAGIADPEARVRTEGLRQAAHVDRARLHAWAANAAGVERVCQEFRLRYPLEAEGRAARALREVAARPVSPDPEKAILEPKPAPVGK